MATVRTGNRSVLLVVDFQVGAVQDAWEAPRAPNTHSAAPLRFTCWPALTWN